MNLSKQYEMIKMLNGLLSRGYTLSESLNMMIVLGNKVMKEIKGCLEKGESLSHIFKKLKFNKLVYETIEIGEKTNRLNDVIELVESYLDFHIKTRNQMSKVLMYPALLLGMAIIVIEFIRMKLYPVITNLFLDFNMEQNQFLIFITFNLLKCLGLVLLVSFFISLLYKPLQNVVPIIKTYRSLYVSHHLKILLGCGYSLEECLDTLSQTLDQNCYDVLTLKTILFEEQSKKSIFTAFSHIFIYFLKMGIRANHLFTSLDDFMTIYFEQINHQLTKIISYIQLSIFALVAGNILLIYYVVMIPMFQMTQSI